MGYRIEYELGSKAYPAHSAKRSRVVPLTVGFFLAFCLLTSVLLPEKWASSRDMLIPGDPAVTKAAFSRMTAGLREGEALGDAVVTFCREIVDGAQLSD